jgi:hypothetical protein
MPAAFCSQIVQIQRKSGRLSGHNIFSEAFTGLDKVFHDMEIAVRISLFPIYKITYLVKCRNGVVPVILASKKSLCFLKTWGPIKNSLACVLIKILKIGGSFCGSERTEPRFYAVLVISIMARSKGFLRLTC